MYGTQREIHCRVTCHTGSHSVTCYQTQVNAPSLNRLVHNLQTPKGWKAELTVVLVI